MPAPLSLDLRRRIIAVWKKRKLTSDEIAVQFDVGPASVTRLIALYRETGSVEPRAHGGGRQRCIAIEQEPLVAALVQAHPDWTEEEYAAELRKAHGIEASDITVGRVIRRLGYSVKKKRSSRKREIARTSKSGDERGAATSESIPFRVWYSWTKPARTSR